MQCCVWQFNLLMQIQVRKYIKAKDPVGDAFDIDLTLGRDVAIKVSVDPSAVAPDKNNHIRLNMTLANGTDISYSIKNTTTLISFHTLEVHK